MQIHIQAALTKDTMDDVPCTPGPIGPYTPAGAAAAGASGAAPEREARIDARATPLIKAIRSRGGLGGLEEVLRQYSLDTREGLALMVLAEALLRVPDDQASLHRMTRLMPACSRISGGASGLPQST
jgi:hypothetical protein